MNGIRAAARKGLYAWLTAQRADVICLQETRAQEHQLPPQALALHGYEAYFVDARKRGYSGVALYTKRAPLSVRRTSGSREMDAEGRFVQADYGDLTVSSVYVPSGISGARRQRVKMEFLSLFRTLLDETRSGGGRHIVCGDFNIAHKDIDIYDPVRNSRVTGFLPAERAWMDSLLARDSGWLDAFRLVNGEPKEYTWWANWPQAWAHNLGWRIDYQIVTSDLGASIRKASIYKEQRFSDHAPLTIEYDVPSFTRPLA